MDKEKKYVKVAGILVIFWCSFVIFYVLEYPYYLLMAKFITALGMSEWNLLEQLSKYYLFIIMLISIIAYKSETHPDRIKLSIGFLLIALAMYLSESNMITNKAQPVFGIVILGYIFYLLLISRSWLTILLLFSGLVTILLGWMADYVSEHQWVNGYFPQFVIGFLEEKVKEELFDAIGQAFICVAVVICFLDNITAFFKKNRHLHVFLVMVASGMITVGDGFMHWQHHPNIKIETVALVLALSGFIALVLLNRHYLEKDNNLILMDGEKQYLFMFFVFVVLPAVHGSHNTMISLVLWFPAIMFVGGYLFFRHPKIILNR